MFGLRHTTSLGINPGYITGNIYQAQIYSGALTQAQIQRVRSPFATPEPGSMAVFGALGMTSLFALRRKSIRHARK